jgi:hypothetical protein
MSSLNWQEVPEKNGSHKTQSGSASVQAPKSVLGFIVGIMSGAAFSFLLMGLIVGYVLGNVLHR